MSTTRRKGGGWKSQEGGRQGSDLIDALQSGIRWQKTTGSRENSDLKSNTMNFVCFIGIIWSEAEDERQAGRGALNCCCSKPHS